MFHNFNQKCQDRWSYSMNATSTHDTKRSEDIRARINVISEIPEQWESQVTNWQELNRPYKTNVKGQEIPDTNDEYFLYQTLVGAFPFFEEEFPEFVERIKSYVVKAVREAKVHTAWLRPDTDYEEGFIAFVEQILQPSPENQFLAKFRSFQQWVAHYGIFNSLAQSLLKIAAPGVPDFYQGTELWDLSLVDPDNRRPVDFEKRRSFYQDIKQRAKTDILSLIADLIANSQDGRLKLFLIARALGARNKYLEVFQRGAYIPLEVVGKYQEHIVAFARHYGKTTAIAIVPCFLTTLVEPPAFPLGEEIWGDTRVEIPQGLEAKWKDAISGREMPKRDTISIGQALQYFPVALLIGYAKKKSVDR
jgi:(1->4)-alpha-D-glucan 1-alpha-D-glucosylmutase